MKRKEPRRINETATIDAINIATLERSGTKNGPDITFRCPAHQPDNNPSAVWHTEKHVWYCHACNENGGWIDLAKRLEITIHEAEPPTPRKPAPKPRITATYDYRDENGKFIFQVLRLEPGPRGRTKTFRQRHQTTAGKWVNNLNGITPVLYNLPAVKQAIKTGQPILFTEGEKDADNLNKLGYTATTNPMGANKWADHYTTALDGANIIILPDNDTQGTNHLHKIGPALKPVTKTLRVLTFPQKDVSDWLEAGGTKQQLDELLETAADYEIPDALNTIQPNNTDLGNAQRLVHTHGKDLRFAYAWDKYLTWTGTHWQVDEDGEVERRAKNVAEDIGAQAEELKEINYEKGEILEKHAKRSEGYRAIQNMILLARSEPGIPIDIKQLNQDPYKITLKNGTYNIKTGKLEPHDKRDHITTLVPVTHDPTAEAPIWMAFLHYIFAGDTDIIQYLQRWLGYTLTGSVREHMLLLAYGTGANGKSVFATTIQHLLGGYAVQASPNLLMSKDRDTHPTEIASLYGKRLAICSELEAGKSFAEVTVKQLTGGDRITARRMREDFWEFEPTHKLFIATNHKPNIRGTDHGIWRRIHLLPFAVTVPPERRNPELANELRAELPGILNWALQGAQDWLESGLRPPDVVLDATAQYESEQDLLGEFISEHCHIGSVATATIQGMYDRYTDWCTDSGYRALGKRNFGQQLEEKGGGKWERRRGTGNRMVWSGIGLLDDHGEAGGQRAYHYN